MDTKETSSFARAGRRILSAGFYAFSAAIWLAVALAGLEVFERGRSYFAERYYQEYFNEQNGKVYGMVPLQEQERARARFTPTKAENVFAAAAFTPAPPVAQDLESARDAYAAQSEENLNVILALRGDVLLVFDRDANLISSHGEPELETFLLPFVREKVLPPNLPMWTEAITAVKTATAPVTLDAELEKNGMPGLRFIYKLTVTPLTEPDGSVRRVRMLFHDITSEMPPERRVGRFLEGPDSPWAIPSYMYKPNWSRPDSISRYNNFGFRDDDMVVPKPAGVVRIVCIGGSTTEEGNSNERTYPRILQGKLRAWLGTDRIEVFNCGICSMASSAERMRMPDYLALQPDLILHYNAINDICHFYFRRWMQDTGRMQGLLGKSKFMARYFNRWYLPPDEYISGWLRATILRNIRAMRYAAREKGVDMACCSFAFPTVSRWDFRDRNFLDINLRTVWHGEMLNFDTYREIMTLYNRLLKETCAREGIFYVPVAENMDAGMDHFFDVCHMTPLGLELKTDIIGAYVKEYVRQRLADPAP